MLGRDIEQERGNPGGASPAHSMSSAENELMGQATRCVRKFAPEGRKKMRRTDNGHITACKISDANPNELIASWSGDHIYSFDLVRSPDATERETGDTHTSISGNVRGKVRESGERKRKWKKANSSTSLDDPRSPRARRVKDDMALRVRYGNGQSEDIAVNNVASTLSSSRLEYARESVLNESQKRSLRIAQSTVKIRQLMFSLKASSSPSGGFSNLSSHTASFTSAMGIAATCLPEMDDISRSWRYPVNPLEEDILLQQTLRGNRESARRFVQAAGTLARLLGATIRTSSRVPSPAMHLFEEIRPEPQEGRYQPSREIFSYDFLKAIVLWLDGGPQALLQGFKRPTNQRKDNPRFPIPDDAQLSGIDDYLMPHLLGLANGGSIPNVDVSRFERDETRQTFDRETAAVVAFASAIKMPLEDLSRAIMPASPEQGDRSAVAAQDRTTALKYWAFKVGRGILKNAGDGVSFQFVDTAFGGLGQSGHEAEEGRVQEDVDLDEEEEVVEKASLVSRPEGTRAENEASGTEATPNVDGNDPSATSAQSPGSDMDIEEAGSDAELILTDDLPNEIAEHMTDAEAIGIDQDNDNDDTDDDNDDEDSDINGDDGDITAEERHFMFQSASDRGKLRENVEKNVPCYSHTRQYRGHCNVKTVKDANFFGIQDEYVVSGSDGGHLVKLLLKDIITSAIAKDSNSSYGTNTAPN